MIGGLCSDLIPTPEFVYLQIHLSSFFFLLLLLLILCVKLHKAIAKHTALFLKRAINIQKCIKFQSHSFELQVKQASQTNRCRSAKCHGSSVNVFKN